MKKMKFSLIYVLLIASFFTFLSINSCKKLNIEKITNIKTEEVAINNTNVIAKGTIIDLNDNDHPDYGFCWAKHANPDINDNVISFGSVNESLMYSHEFTGLEVNVNYYICAFVYDGSEVKYGEIVQFVITPSGITVESKSILVTSYTTVQAKGKIEGVGSVEIQDYGHCWSTGTSPSINDNATNLGTLGQDTSYTSELTGLNSGTTYFVCAYAKLDNTTIIYGDTVSFNISELMVTTDSVTITNSSVANAGGIINSLGFQSVTNHGHCWSTNPNPTISDNQTSIGPVIQTGLFSSNLTGLDTNTTYYVRAYAENALGVKYGAEKSFIIQAFEVTTTSAMLTSDQTADAIGFLTIGSYSLSEHGHCWSTTFPPTVNDFKTSLGAASVSGSYTSPITGLDNNMTYYIRAYARDGSNLKYGKTITLVTKNFWTQLTDFSGSSRTDAVSFVIGGKAYIGGGVGTAIQNDFWEFDTLSGAWTQKANYTDTVIGAVGFSVGTKGYVGTGIGTAYYNKRFFEYEPTSNSWTQKAIYGGDSISGAVAFSIGTKGYVGTGYNGSGYKNDFWEYNPTNNAWTQKASFTGQARNDAVGFAIGNMGYVGLGSNGTTYYSDFYQYNPTSNNWTTKTSFGGISRIGAVGFVRNGKGFVGLGYNSSAGFQNDFWEYDPGSNAWVQKADFSGTSRWNAIGFSIGINAFVTTGNDGSNKKDFWKYIPN